MIKKLLPAIAALILALSGELKAQDPEFTQFYANPLYLNPAFAGTARCPRICLNYRNQWPAISGTFVTYSASYDQHIDGLSGGLGLLVTSDQAGLSTLTTTNISGIYSYQATLSKDFSLKVGFQATYTQKKVDWDKLNFGDMIDPRRGFVWNTNEKPGLSSRANLDVSAGILGFSKRYFFGAAVHHITQPDESLLSQGSPLPMKITGHAGAIIPFQKGNEKYISPNIIYQVQQNFQQLNLGMYVVSGPIVGGLWYRNQDAFILLIGLQKDQIKLGYSYDVTISRLGNATAGSHELSFQLQFQCKPKHKKFRTVSCPSF